MEEKRRTKCEKESGEKKIFGVFYHPNPTAVFFRSPEISPSDRHDFRTVASLHIKEGGWMFSMLGSSVSFVALGSFSTTGGGIGGSSYEIPLRVVMALALFLGFRMLNLKHLDHLGSTHYKTCPTDAVEKTVTRTLPEQVVFEGGKNWFMNFETRSSHVRIERGGSLASQVRASPSRENGKSKSLIVVFGTFGCLNVEVTLLKNRR
nr:hypothetical protein [Tanacetum cinerariifolium]